MVVSLMVLNKGFSGFFKAGSERDDQCSRLARPAVPNNRVGAFVFIGRGLRRDDHYRVRRHEKEALLMELRRATSSSIDPGYGLRLVLVRLSASGQD